ncbi:MAG TPA: HEAT repeat domain-containing protein [Spirochaetota bacterium]|nr:HEAT repeat domain-containing protein [Spirochaetota bacterium]
MPWWKARKKGGEQTGETLKSDTEQSGENTKDKKKHKENGIHEATRVRSRSGGKDEHQRKNGRTGLFSQLVASLKDGNASVRSHAAWSLGRMGDARAVDPLVGLVNDKDPEVRKEVAEALKRLGWKNKP